MDYQQLINTMTPDIYEQLKTAVELGKWPNGDRLSAEQKQQCLQAVIAYDQQHKPEEERVGFIHTKKHAHCASDNEPSTGSSNDSKPLKWI